MNWKFGLIGLLAILLAVFTAQNTEVVEVRFLFFSLEMSRAIMIFGVFVVGLLAGWLLPGLLLKRPKPRP